MAVASGNGVAIGRQRECERRSKRKGGWKTEEREEVWKASRRVSKGARRSETAEVG